jgi:hypothetical protein
VVWLQEVEAPVLAGRSNRALANYALDLKKALERSNLDKANLRSWLESEQKQL